MRKRRRGDRNYNEVETVTFSIPEDNLDSTQSSSTTTSTPATTLSPPLSEQVFNVSEWTIETDRVSTSNTLFSSMVEPVPSMSFKKSDHDLHIPSAYLNCYQRQVCLSVNLTMIFTFRVLISITTMLWMSLIFNLLLNLSNLLYLQILRALKPRK
jgi:hypothetical protein